MCKVSQILSIILTLVILLPFNTSANTQTLDHLPVGMMPVLAESLAKDQAKVFSPTLINTKSGKTAFKISNPQHQMKAEFKREGVSLKIRDSEIDMELISFGRGDKLNKILPVNPQIDGVKLSYQHEQVKHWFINSPMGLEQGFTVNKKLKGEGELAVKLKFDSLLRAQLKKQQLQFVNHHGKTKLNYGQLVAFDSRGKSLVSRMQLASNELTITVDDEAAVYPIIIDPMFSAETFLTASDGLTLGYSVSISGDTLVVGRSTTLTGSVYVYQRNFGGKNNWGEVAKLTANDGANQDHFGSSVAISGNTIVVGAYGRDDSGLSSSGAVYIYEYIASSDQWTFSKKLNQFKPEANDNFGWSVAIDKDTVVVGAQLDEEVIKDAGTARIFMRNEGGTGNWGELPVILVSDDAASSDFFGRAVAISGDTIIVGKGLAAGGTVAVFDRAKGGANAWGQVQSLASQGGYFGTSLAIDKNTLVVGSSSTNTAYVYSRPAAGESWTEGAKLSASDSVAGDFFGWSVDVDGDTVAVGAVFGADSGSTYLFHRNSGGADNWGEVKKLLPSKSAAGDLYGQSVAISGNQMVVGTQNSDIAFLYQASVDLDVVLQDDVDPIVPGNSLVYTASVTNNDVEVNATNVALDISLPAGVSYVENDSGCTELLGTVSCVLSNLAIKMTKSVSVVVDAATAGLQMAAADVQSDILDLSTTNNSDVENTIINTPTSVSGTPVTSVVHATPYNFLPIVTDADNQLLIFTITNLPSWASFDADTGAVTGTPVLADTGIYSGIVINVSDGFSSINSPEFSIEVTNAAPTITGAPSFKAEVGQNYIFLPAGNDVDGDTLSYSGSNLPVWMSLNSVTGSLTGTPVLGDLGTYTDIQISVSDGLVTVDLAPFSIDVVEQIPEVIISGSPIISINEGSDYSFTPTVSGGGNTKTFSIINPPSWATFDTNTGELSGLVSVLNIGTYADIQISVTDGTTSASLATFSVVVNDVPLIITGNPVSSLVNTSAYSFTPMISGSSGTLDFSVQNLPSWATFDTTSGQLSGMATTGNYPNIIITVTDGFDTVSLAGFNILVRSVPPVISGSPLLVVSSGSGYSFIPTASDAELDTLNFSIQNQPSWANFNGGTGELSGIPIAANVGIDTNIIISVSDGESVVSLAAFDIEVTNSAPVALDDIVDGTLVSTFSNFIEIDVLANDTDVNNDSLTVSLLSSTSSMGNAITVLANGNISYVVSGSGTDSFSYTVTDLTGASDTATVTIDLGTGTESGGGGASISPWWLFALFVSLLLRRQKVHL